MENGQSRAHRDSNETRQDTSVPADRQPKPDYPGFLKKASKNLTAAAVQDLRDGWAPAKHRPEAPTGLPDAAFADAGA